MCGRFHQTTPLQKLAKLFKAELKMKLDEYKPLFNVAPSLKVPAVYVPNNQTERVLESLKWGLVPAWANDPAIGFKLANARGETVAEKPSFKTAFKKQRCLIPVNGFYEWKQDSKPKQPYYFKMKDEETFALAGLWEFWKPKTGDGEPIYSFTLITTTPNKVLEPVHDRMPVILNEKDYDAWLDPKNNDIEKLLKLIQPYPDTKMTGYAVSTFVSASKNQGPDCIKPLGE
jgi:putative SOS response-associated peptidase YedK